MKHTQATVSRQVPAIDVDGCIFSQDGCNIAAPEDYYRGPYILRDCTDQGGVSWRFMGGGLDFYEDSPEACIVRARELATSLRTEFGLSD